MTCAPTQENGSIFFVILMAIGMFAALSYAIMEGSRTSSSSLTREQASLKAQEIISYADTVAKAVQTLRLHGVEEEQISLEGAGGDNYTNGSCSSDECRIFAYDGGNVNALAPPEGSNDGSAFVYSGRIGVENIGVDGGADGAELMMFLPNVKKEVCIRINETLKVTVPGLDPPANNGDTAYAGVPFQGSFSGGDTINGSIFRQKSAGCFEGNGTPAADTYHFYRVLIAR